MGEVGEVGACVGEVGRAGGVGWSRSRAGVARLIYRKERSCRCRERVCWRRKHKGRCVRLVCCEPTKQGRIHTVTCLRRHHTRAFALHAGVPSYPPLPAHPAHPWATPTHPHAHTPTPTHTYPPTYPPTHLYFVVVVSAYEHQRQHGSAQAPLVAGLLKQHNLCGGEGTRSCVGHNTRQGTRRTVWRRVHTFVCWT